LATVNSSEDGVAAELAKSGWREVETGNAAEKSK
jgi:hypothetical protein